LRTVFDTTVYVSALVVPGSLSDEAYRRARIGDAELFASVAILTELASKLRSKFGWEPPPITEALKSISRVAVIVKTTPHLSIVDDATDNRILECGEAVDADVIVTGDPHLLKLRRFGRAGIVKVSTFLRMLGPVQPTRPT
jgi:putative PIN family toxin of toxin-antitoxin system